MEISTIICLVLTSSLLLCGLIILAEKHLKKRTCILVDIDGTVAERCPTINRSPYDWMKVNTDLPKKDIIQLVKTLRQSGYKIIFLTGRDEICKDITIDWICTHFGWLKNDITIFTRPLKDNRKDNIIKKELYENHIKGKYNVELVLDDRDQVVEMWRKELGLTCLQVNYGNF